MGGSGRPFLRGVSRGRSVRSHLVESRVRRLRYGLGLILALVSLPVAATSTCTYNGTNFVCDTAGEAEQKAIELTTAWIEGKTCNGVPVDEVRAVHHPTSQGYNGQSRASTGSFSCPNWVTRFFVGYRYTTSCEFGDTGPPPSSGGVYDNMQTALSACVAESNGFFAVRHSSQSSTVYSFVACEQGPNEATYVNASFDVQTYQVQGEQCLPFGPTTPATYGQFSWSNNNQCAARGPEVLPATWEQSSYCSAGCEMSLVTSCTGGGGCMNVAQPTGATCGGGYNPSPNPNNPNPPGSPSNPAPQPPGPNEPPAPPPPPPPPEGENHSEGLLRSIRNALDSLLGSSEKHRAEAVNAANATTGAVQSGANATVAAINDQTGKLGDKLDGIAGALGGDKSVDGVGFCGEGYICAGDPIACALLREQNDLKCRAADYRQEDQQERQDDESSLASALDGEEPDPSEAWIDLEPEEINQSLISFGAPSCNALFPSVTVAGQQWVPPAALCSLLASLRLLFVAISLVWAVRIVGD